MIDNLSELEKQLENISTNLSSNQKQQLNLYYQLLNEYSQKINLTTITSLEGVYIKHFYDSLLLGKSINLNQEITLCDVGTGAGFPGLVLKIVYPNIKVTLLEPTKKRCDFLQTVIDKLELKDVRIVNERAEIYISKGNCNYDVVCARAVAQLNILLELCSPLVKINGLFIAMKGQAFKEELENSKNACKKLNLQNMKIDNYNLPNDEGERAILVFKKIAKTPSCYPRPYAKIKKNPL